MLMLSERSRERVCKNCVAKSGLGVSSGGRSFFFFLSGYIVVSNSITSPSMHKAPESGVSIESGIFQ